MENNGKASSDKCPLTMAAAIFPKQVCGHLAIEIVLFLEKVELGGE